MERCIICVNFVCLNYYNRVTPNDANIVTTNNAELCGKAAKVSASCCSTNCDTKTELTSRNSFVSLLGVSFYLEYFSCL